MTSENAQNKNQATALNDSELNEVTGGYNYTHDASTDKYYQWNGNDLEEDHKYVCPNCKRPVHHGLWRRFYCDPCDASWLQEDRLLPNLNSGLWREISKSDYERWS